MEPALVESNPLFLLTAAVGLRRSAAELECVLEDDARLASAVCAEAFDDEAAAPLHKAAEVGFVEAVDALLNKGARINAVLNCAGGGEGELASTRSETALHVAVRCCYLGVARRLLELGADPGLKGFYRRPDSDLEGTPLDYAQAMISRSTEVCNGHAGSDEDLDRALASAEAEPRRKSVTRLEALEDVVALLVDAEVELEDEEADHDPVAEPQGH